MNTIKKAVFSIFAFSVLFSCQESDDTNTDSSSVQRTQVSTCDTTRDAEEARNANADLNLDFNIIYSIRDNILDKSPRGTQYADEYYDNSLIAKDYTNFNIQTFYDIIDLMPYVYEAHNHMIDSNYTGVIINSTLRDKLINVLNGHKVLTNDVKYINMIDRLIDDSNTLTGKNKSEVESFMQIVY